MIESCVSPEDFEIKEYTKDFSSSFIERSYEKEFVSFPHDSVDFALVIGERMYL